MYLNFIFHNASIAAKKDFYINFHVKWSFANVMLLSIFFFGDREIARIILLEYFLFIKSIVIVHTICAAVLVYNFQTFCAANYFRRVYFS